MRRIAILLFLTTNYLFLFSDIQIQTVSYYTSVTYDAIFGVNKSQTIKLTYTDSPGDFFLTFSGGLNGDINDRYAQDWKNNGASYQLHTSGGRIIKDLSVSPGENEVLSGVADQSQGQIILDYFIYMPANSSPQAGSFTDTVTITLYKGNIDNYTKVSSVNVQFAIQVQGIVSMSIVPKDTPFDINKTDLTLDFGELTSGDKREADIIIISNQNFKLDFSSSGGGALNRTDSWSEIVIPYTCLINGNQVSFVPWQAVTVYESGPADGDTLNVEFIISDFWDVPDGVYKDNITVTISAL